MGSARFRILVKEIATLRNYLLPHDFDPTGAYTDAQQQHFRSFRLLVHAEVESYLEDRCKDTALHALGGLSAGKTGRTLAAMLAYRFTKLSRPPRSIPVGNTPRQNTIILDDRIQHCCDKYFGVLMNNHGIKEANLLRLLLPVGVNFAMLDQSWIISMNSYGEMRGRAAHSAASALRIAHSINPEDEIRAISQLLRGLKVLDQQFEMLKTQ